MATKNIINTIEKGYIANDLKSAYKFMLLSRGYSADEVQILDEYDFFVSDDQVTVLRKRSGRAERCDHF